MNLQFWGEKFYEFVTEKSSMNILTSTVLEGLGITFYLVHTFPEVAVLSMERPEHGQTAVTKSICTFLTLL